MKEHMDKSVNLFYDAVRCVRTGNVSPALVDTVKVLYYGQKLPIKQLAMTGKIGDSISVEPYDPQIVNSVAKALVEAGFKAYASSKTRVTVSVPPMSGEQKQEVITHLKKLAEEAKVAVRNIRKGYRQGLSKEDQKSQDKSIQETTDHYISEIDNILSNKMESL